MFIDRIRSRWKLILIPVIISTAVILSGFLILSYSYSDAPAPSHALDTIPPTAITAVEIQNPGQAYTLLAESEIALIFKKRDRLTRLLSLPEMKKLSSLLYYFEVKTGGIITLTDIPSFFDETIAFATFKNNEFLFAGSTTMKGKVLISLHSLLKGNREPLAFTERESPDSKKPVGHDSFQNLTEEKDIRLRDITVRRVSFSGENSFYLVFIGRFLIISSSQDLLQQSLTLMAKKGEASLTSLPGMDTALDNTSKPSVSLYLHRSVLPFAPLYMEGRGIAAHFPIEKTKPITGTVHYIDADESWYQSSSSSSAGHTGHLMHQSYPLVLSYSEKGLNAIFTQLQKDTSVSKSALQLGKAMGLPVATAGKGVSFAFQGFRFYDKEMLPHFIMITRDTLSPTKMIQGLFNTESLTRSTSEGITSFLSAKGQNRFFSPSYFSHEDFSIIGTDAELTRLQQSSMLGRAPRLSDTDTSIAGSKAPLQIFISAEPTVEAIKDIFRFGEIHSKRYSEKTLQQDVYPFLDPFKKYKALNIELGIKGKKQGTFRVIPSSTP